MTKKSSLIKNKKFQYRRARIGAALIGLLCVCALSVLLSAQGILEPHPYMERGLIIHQGATATLKSDHARPLAQAIQAINEEYKWDIHYEDPPYQGNHDLADGYNPAYRAAHPGLKPFPGVNGGAFSSTYSEWPDMWTSKTHALQVLTQIVSDYNRSGNPGHFSVRSLSDGSLDVVGDGTHDDSGNVISVTPILDTPISIPLATRSFGGTIFAVMKALSARTGVTANGPAFGPTNFMMGGQYSIGGTTPAPARDFLLQLFAAEKSKFTWTLLYEPPPMPEQFLLGVRPVQRAVYDMFGHRRN
jgi:hypothetical protein